MKFFLYVKVHMNVQKRLQVRIHDDWDPSSMHHLEHSSNSSRYRTVHQTEVEVEVEAT